MSRLHPRTARTLLSSIGAGLALAILSVGTAGAATVSPQAAVSAHGFGARKPTGVVAPLRTNVGARVATALSIATPPVAVDLRAWAVTPGYQGSLNSCVPWAIDYALLGWYSRYTGRTGQPFAPMYTYSQISRDGDYGSEPTEVLQLAERQGSDTRSHYTQGDYNWKSVPTAAEHLNAANYKIAGYTVLFKGAEQPGVIAALQLAISTKHPVALTLAARHGFETLGAGAATTDNDTTSPILGYHEVLAVGYDAAGLIVQNSWGTTWANRGFGRISWDVVAEDAWEGETISGFAALPKAPGVTVPRVLTTVVNATTASTTTRIVAWKGALGNTGPITRFDAWLQTDGHARVGVRLASAKVTSVRLVLRRGHLYRLSVRARAGAFIGKIYYGAWFRV